MKAYCKHHYNDTSSPSVKSFPQLTGEETQRHTELFNYVPLQLTEEASNTSGSETLQTPVFLGPNLYKIIITLPITGLPNTCISKCSSNSKTLDIHYTDLQGTLITMSCVPLLSTAAC